MLTTTKIVLLLIVILLVFGTKKLRSLGGDLGSAIKDFKKNVSDDKSKTDDSDDAQPAKTISQTAEKQEEANCCDHDQNKDPQHKA